MRIREENRNMVLLGTVTLLAAAVAAALALLEPTTPVQTAPAYLPDSTSVRVVGGAPFVPNVNPREHR
jgi:hypothetical protein